MGLGAWSMGTGRNREISVFESTDKGKWGQGETVPLFPLSPCRLVSWSAISWQELPGIAQGMEHGANVKYE